MPPALQRELRHIGQARDEQFPAYVNRRLTPLRANGAELTRLCWSLLEEA